MNNDQLKGKWKQASGEVQKQWGKLTADHLTEINGNFDKLVGKIQEVYGVSKTEATKQINEWEESPTFKKMRDSWEDGKAQIKEKVGKMTADDTVETEGDK